MTVHKAAQRGDIKTVKEQVEKDKQYVNMKDKNQWTVRFLFFLLFIYFFVWKEKTKSHILLSLLSIAALFLSFPSPVAIKI